MTEHSHACTHSVIPYSFCGREDPDAERDWGQEEKGTAQDEMAGWHHLLDGRVFE